MFAENRIKVGQTWSDSSGTFFMKNILGEEHIICSFRKTDEITDCYTFTFNALFVKTLKLVNDNTRYFYNAKTDMFFGLKILDSKIWQFKMYSDGRVEEQLYDKLHQTYESFDKAEFVEGYIESKRNLIDDLWRE